MFSNNKPYRDFAEFFSAKFPCKVQKISVNAGFTCPNRDGSKGRGGCTYCNNQSFSPGYGRPTKSISEQLADGITFFSHKYPEMKYLAYFQSYTNTYDSLDSLILKYEEALSYPGVVGLIVGTRPDCMPAELLDYFEVLSKKTFVMVEYGVESTLNKTLERVNRQHTYEESAGMIRETAGRNIMTGAHMILGLPGESTEDILSHADTLSRLPLTTLKLHQLQIIKGTAMAKEFRLLPESFHLFGLDEYIDLCVDFAERLNPAIYIERFTSQSPKKLLIAPAWDQKNYVVTEKIIKRFLERETWQGRLYSPQQKSF
ncbi:TIGR01212 family radical SAM protein [uncultured Proteiniphilum sp.]|uniref:TIGR01212 family radical SAM protein n=1 Tax=uncultured Proteiniphilum sp. TaxID=497637 RepID=UPI00260D03E8|nr:TIGR01212 family radical SAM protein [uncultured Proteiniphilum sp.]